MTSIMVSAARDAAKAIEDLERLGLNVARIEISWWGAGLLPIEIVTGPRGGVDGLDTIEMGADGKKHKFKTATIAGHRVRWRA